MGLATLASFVLSGCTVEIGERRVFAPELASDLRFSFSDGDGPIIVDNRAAPGRLEARIAQRRSSLIHTASGAIAVRRYVSRKQDAPLVLFCGGNAFAMQHHADMVAYSFADHADVLFWDYPGFGLSEGAPGVEAIRRAGAAVLDRLNRFRRHDAQPVILWGYSLGGFVAAELAQRCPDSRAVAFEACAPSARSAAKFLAPPILRRIARIRLHHRIAQFDNVAALAGKSLPVLVLAAKRDQILPYGLSEDLRDQLIAGGHRVLYKRFDDADHFGIGFAAGRSATVGYFLAQLQGG